MAHLWIRGTSGWDAQRLDAAESDLAAVAIRLSPEAEPGMTTRNAPRLIRIDADGSPVWAMVSSCCFDVCVNGSRLISGLRVLADRDEIRAGGVQYFFSTETLAVLEEFPGLEHEIFCGRCRQLIQAGSPAVRCPGCQIWYHQNDSDGLGCWTYSAKCNFCPSPTPLDTGFTWTPEEE